MARCGFATWNPKGTTPGGKIDPRVVIFHVTAGLGNAQPHDHLEWHFEVSLSGQLEQQVDTNLRADANYKANPFAISVETEGKGDGVWTDAQLVTLVRLSHWCIDVHPKVKAQRCDAWDGSGFGYHIMWGSPGPWTPVAKSCPGPRRIEQFDAVLLPRILAPVTPPPPPEDDMPPSPAIVNVGGVDFTFVKGIDNALHVHDGVQWRKLGGRLTSAPSATPAPDGMIHVAVRGDDGGSYLTVFNPADRTLAGWKNIGGRS